MKTLQLVWTVAAVGGVVALDQACAAGAPPDFFYGDAGFIQSSSSTSGTGDDSGDDTTTGDDAADTGSGNSGSASGSSSGSNGGSATGSGSGSAPAQCDAMSCPTGCCDMNGM